ncbi:UNVERIFIED_CONTAM: hypothetical protein Slati_0982900 [Sesamum latifolium]|uniref:Uncharacterized protein n=1 Tax=Sesamum latifolium TaxID=2727402 RepID=A0AAW2XU83_9LAMI
MDIPRSVEGRTVWTASLTSGSWSWRKMLRLRAVLLPHITFRIGDGTKFSLWHDPWHQLGPLISRYPLGPNVTGTHSADRLQRMIVDGSWRWPAIPGMGMGRSLTTCPPYMAARILFSGMGQRTLNQWGRI